MATWAEFEAAAPELASAGRRLVYGRGDGEALLATVRGEDPPRIHPVNIGIVGGRLYTFVIGRSYEPMSSRALRRLDGWRRHSSAPPLLHRSGPVER